MKFVTVIDKQSRAIVAVIYKIPCLIRSAVEIIAPGINAA